MFAGSDESTVEQTTQLSTLLRLGIPPSLAWGFLGLLLFMVGAGASVWVGPALVAVFLKPLGLVGMMWLFAVLYLVSGILALALHLPSEEAVRNSEAF